MDDDSPESLHARARQLLAAGRLAEAADALRMAAERDPRVEIVNDLAVVLRHAGRNAEAVAEFRRAITLDPTRPEPHANLGNALRSTGDLSAAIDAYQESLRIAPANPATLNNLAATLQDVGELDQALAIYRQATRLDPASPAIHGNLLYALHFHPASTPTSLLEEHRRWNNRHALSLPHPPYLSSGNRLRVGYVSPDFHQHVIARFLLPILAHHDRAGFEISLYSNLSAGADQTTARLQQLSDHWRPIAHLSDLAAADLIRADGIDILVDLTMHMANNRLPLFALKPAPIQVTYLAYPGTTGLDAMDYRLTDPHLDPPGNDADYAERSVRLSETYWCYAPPFPIPSAALRDRHSPVTFGSVNNYRKVSAGALAVWAGIVRAVPDSRLHLHTPRGPHRQDIISFFARTGVSAKRIHFLDPVPLDEYFRLYDEIDVALDSFPYAGGTTTLDAAYMGVPTITLAGRTAVGRGGVSINTNLGLPDLIAQDTDQYVRTAVALANDRPRLAELRATLRQRMESSPLMDAPRFVRGLESIYRQMGALGFEPRTKGL